LILPDKKNISFYSLLLSSIPTFLENDQAGNTINIRLETKGKRKIGIYLIGLASYDKNTPHLTVNKANVMMNDAPSPEM